MASAGIGVGVDESAQFGIVITGLEIVERGLSVVDIAAAPQYRLCVKCSMVISL